MHSGLPTSSACCAVPLAVASPREAPGLPPLLCACPRVTTTTTIHWSQGPTSPHEALDPNTATMVALQAGGAARLAAPPQLCGPRTLPTLPLAARDGRLRCRTNPLARRPARPHTVAVAASLSQWAANLGSMLLRGGAAAGRSREAVEQRRQQRQPQGASGSPTLEVGWQADPGCCRPPPRHPVSCARTRGAPAPRDGPTPALPCAPLQALESDRNPALPTHDRVNDALVVLFDRGRQRMIFVVGVASSAVRTSVPQVRHSERCTAGAT